MFALFVFIYTLIESFISYRVILNDSFCYNRPEYAMSISVFGHSYQSEIYFRIPSNWGSFYFSGFSYFSYYLAVFLILTAFTKSAQFPFSGWLPKAMSAPTPVSSLVHSSTLVTAGLVLLMNFNCLVFSKSLISVVLIVGVFTMFFSSVSALFEEDLKKVVALSTLSQIGFSMVTLGLGLNFVCFIHLLRHALFKSCLFMQVGYIIHCSFGQQDGRNYNGVGNLPYYIQVQILVTLFCLCGLVFSRGSV
uniref:NADH:ubiquinone reductase (H(+)-translocating) n=1 Tax=Parastrongyloides trichosuri TaxID=131310 RepID=A0A0N5A069_PARTI